MGGTADEVPTDSTGGWSWGKKWAVGIFSLLAVVVVTFGGFVTYLSHSWDSGTQRVPLTQAQDSERRPGTNILLLGSDAYSSGSAPDPTFIGQRSDLMMVAHIPDDHSKGVQVLSLPRDLWVSIEGHGKAKLNAALSYGGVELAVDTVSDLIAAQIDHVMVIDFEGFRSITDALGGVDVMVYEEFTNGSEAFPVGINHLDGDRALNFVRARYPFPTGDFQRMRNQQSLVKAVISKFASAGTLANPLKITRVVRGFSPYVTIDEGLNARGAVSLLAGLRGIRASEYRFATIPTGPPGESEDGQQYLSVDGAEIDRLRQEFAHDSLDTYVLELARQR